MSCRNMALLGIGAIILALVPIFVTDAYMRHLFIIAFIFAIIASNWDLSL